MQGQDHKGICHPKGLDFFLVWWMRYNAPELECLEFRVVPNYQPNSIWTPKTQKHM